MTNPLEMIENVYIKKSLWAFEQEYCSVIISREYRYDDLKIYYPDEVLSEVIFGYRTSDEAIKKVIELIKNNYSNFNNIKYYRAVPNRNKFTLELKEL